MIIPDTAIKNRVSVVILAIIIFIFGLHSYKTLPRENNPDISIPYVFISTSYKGVSSSDIETSITIPIEKKLKGLEAVKQIHSISSEGESRISIEFIAGTDIDDVLRKVKDKVDESKNDLPGDLENDPSVYEFNFSELPIVIYSLSGNCGIPRLKEIADNLEEDIESVPGVLEVEITGGSEREIIIEIDPDKLSFYQLPVSFIFNSVKNENLNTSGGAISLGDGRYQVRVPGEITAPNELYNIVITTFNGNPVYLKEIATIVNGFEDEESRSRLNGREAITLSVKKRSGENALAISTLVDDLIELDKTTWPKGTEITKIKNDAKMVRDMLKDLENNIFSGLLLVILVLFFALGLRNATLVALAIPFSMLLSFMILNVMGMTLNMVVLFSLTLALGMLVDNAIVIVENIYRYMEQGVPRIEAAMKATSEVAYPVIGSTLTTIAAFFPIVFWPGIMGEFMSYLPLTLIITLSSSLFVALVINPAIAAFFMKVKQPDKSKPVLSADEVEASGEKPIQITGWILETYSYFINKALENRTVVLISSVLILVVIFQIWLLVVGIEKPTEFFPKIDPNNIYVNIEPPEGADLDYIDTITRKVEMVISSVLDKSNESQYNDFITSPPVKNYETSYQPKFYGDSEDSPLSGPTGFRNIRYVYAKMVKTFSGASFSNNSDNHLGIQFVDLVDRKTPSAKDLEEIRNRVKFIPGARITVEEESEGPPTGPPVNIEISGDNYDQLGTISKQMRSKLSKLPNIADLRDDYVNAIPSIKIKVDRQKAAMLDLSTSNIGSEIKTAYSGMIVSTYHSGDDDFDITVKLSEKNRKVIDKLRSYNLSTPSGKRIPLNTVASISYTGSQGNIVRINHKKVVTIKANVEGDKIPGTLLRSQAEELLNDFYLPAGYTYKFTGENEEQKESEEFLSRAFTIAVFSIFLILVTLFNSVSQPVIIMSSVILSIGGAMLGLIVLKLPFGIIMTGVGIISLAGVVVNNAIVLIDYTNKLRERGHVLKEAIVLAGATRLRPVILTAITTILGLIPMVTGISFDFTNMTLSLVSESSQYWQSMAIVVIFGLLVATVLTLIVVPTLYSILEEMPGKLKNAYVKANAYYWELFDRLFGT